MISWEFVKTMISNVGTILVLLKSSSWIKNLVKKGISFIKLQIRVVTGKQEKIRKLIDKYQLPKTLRNKDSSCIIITDPKTGKIISKEDI